MPAIGFPQEYQSVIAVDVCQVAKKFYPRAAFGNIEGNESQPILLGGRNGYVKTGTAHFFKLGSTVRVRRLVFFENGKEYSIDYRYIPNMADYESVFTDLLQSFKFLEVPGK